MFAIRISEENLRRILDSKMYDLDASTVEWFTTLFNKNWYLISGYVSLRGAVHSWTVFPGSYFEKNFEYDTTKIQTDWDQIVRK